MQSGQGRRQHPVTVGGPDGFRDRAVTAVLSGRADLVGREVTDAEPDR